MGDHSLPMATGVMMRPERDRGLGSPAAGHA